MPDTEPLTLLFLSLQDHGIIFNPKDLQKILNSESGRAIETWINEHLKPETLLTEEELTLYLALEEGGELDVLSLSRDLTLVRGVHDRDLQVAIEELRRSTALIEKQTETLKLQQEALTSLVKGERQDREARAGADYTQLKKWKKENNHTSVIIDELLQSLRFQTVEIGSQCKTADVTLRKIALELLGIDDKLLSGLQKLASGLNPEQEQEDGVAWRIRNLCTRLIKFTVEAVRTRLDRVYLDAMDDVQDIQNRSTTDYAEVAGLREELESLYTEILPVAQMSAEQQYLQPALRLLTADNAQGLNRSRKATEYISECLVELTNRLEDFAARTEDYQDYRKTVTELIKTVRAELEDDYPSSPKLMTSNPIRSRKSSKPISPVRPRNSRRRSSATSFDDEINPEEQFLRNLGISLAFEPADEHAAAETLLGILTDRRTRLRGHARGLQEASESSIASHLYDSLVTLQLLMESLLSETIDGTVGFLDTEIGEAIRILEKDVEEVRSGIAAIGLDKLKERSVRRDDFVERWQ